MPLPHFAGPKQQEYVYKDLYEVIFVYNTDIHDLRLIESVFIDFDLESNDRKLTLVLKDTFELDHSFGDVDIVIINIYDGTGEVRRRMLFGVTLSKYNQEFSQKDNFQKYLEDVSRVNIIFNVGTYDVIVDDYLSITPIENWIRDYKIDKILK
jgi:hypothetical protein